MSAETEERTPEQKMAGLRLAIKEVTGYLPDGFTVLMKTSFDSQVGYVTFSDALEEHEVLGLLRHASVATDERVRAQMRPTLHVDKSMPLPGLNRESEGS